MGNFVSKKKPSPKPRNNYEEIFLLNKSLAEDNDYERMHLAHNLTRELFEGNFSSPIKTVLSDNDTKILDIGCGAGYWLTEMAADFPTPEYFGIDMLPIFPKSNQITFLQHNFLQGLPFESDTFDFIHLQNLALDFTKSEWETIIYQEVVRVLKPGGWLEASDMDVRPVNSGPITDLLCRSACKTFTLKNIDPDIIQCHDTLMKSIPTLSSSNISHELRNLPCGRWANRLGESGSTLIRDASKIILQGQAGKYMNIKRKNINSTLDEIVHELELYRTCFNVHRFYVQKPH